ncbi:MAG TPA: 6-carboxytetrahydropterin synthase [Syntrophomonadaceae bacterium]|nr:6-carboxytetrahydropterin synthase [Syntrophomonadaceae bacterium]HPR92812.1 6-carboxytetrahydropterin synthase [Syntrophomonadaceae bacterium]
MNDPDNSLHSGTDLITLSGELNDILAAYELTLQKSTGLTAEITACEARQEYIEASLAEGQRIASEVLRNAELRVENITAGSNRLIIPQQKLIARIENEITELTELLASLTAAAEQTNPEKSGTTADNTGISADTLHGKLPAREYVPVMSTAPVTDSELMANPPQTELPTRESEPVMSTVPVTGSQLPMEKPRVHLPAAIDPAVSNPQTKPAISTKPPAVFAGDRNPDNDSAVAGYLPEEADKSSLHLDVDVNFKCYQNADKNSGYLHNHYWKIKIAITIPEDNYEFVRYGKVPQAIKSTVLRYDKAILNDIFPFDIISPNLNNIGTYFFNCLDDNVSFMNLKLTEVTIWQNEALLMRVNRRDAELDKLLQGGDDILGNLRGKFYNQ